MEFAMNLWRKFAGIASEISKLSLTHAASGVSKSNVIGDLRTPSEFDETDEELFARAKVLSDELRASFDAFDQCEATARQILAPGRTLRHSRTMSGESEFSIASSESNMPLVLRPVQSTGTPFSVGTGSHLTPIVHPEELSMSRNSSNLSLSPLARNLGVSYYEVSTPEVVEKPILKKESGKKPKKSAKFVGDSDDENTLTEIKQHDVLPKSPYTPLRSTPVRTPSKATSSGTPTRTPATPLTDGKRQARTPFMVMKQHEWQPSPLTATIMSP